MKAKLCLLVIFLFFSVYSFAQAEEVEEVDVLIIDIEIEASALAETGGLINAAIIGNDVIEQDVENISIIEGSFSDNTGIVNVNQDTGNISEQFNLTAIAIAEGLSAVILQSIDVGTEISSNSVVSIDATKHNIIEDSFNNNVGIIAVNQNSGNMNILGNFIALGIGVAVDESVILNESDLGEINSSNSVNRTGGDLSNTMTDSFINNTGIAQVNQISGDMNSSINRMSISMVEVYIR